MPSRFLAAGELPKLGDLEIAVLEYVWSNAGVSAKVVYEAVGKSRGISLNTVQSALERLYRKGLLTREKNSHSYDYVAVVGRDELIARFIGSLLGRFGADASSALAAFVEASDDIDPDELKRLESILRRRRRETRE